MSHHPQIPRVLWPCEHEDAEWLHEVQCANCKTCGLEHRVMRHDLEQFVVDVLAHYKVSPAEGATAAECQVPPPRMLADAAGEGSPS